MLEYRKWATCYMERGKVDLVKKALKEDPKLRDKFEIKLTDRMGERPMSGGRDWNPLMPDAKTTLNYEL